MRPRLEPLTRDELDTIHGATLRVLETVGIRVLDPEAAGLLHDAGASVDASSGLVRASESLIREWTSAAPRRFKLYGRNPKHVLSFGEGNTYLSPVGTAVGVEDLEGDFRPAVLEDVERFHRLADALPHLDHASWAVWPRDVPEESAHAYLMLSGFRNATKPVDGYNLGRERTRQTIEMAAIVAGGRDALVERPLLLGFANPVSPLMLNRETTEGLIEYARHGQPTTIPPECMSGGTSPATLAGLLVQQNAEILLSVAIAQLARRGAPVLYGSASTIMDMRTGGVALGAPEAGLVMVATAQLARYYGIPSRGTGGNTEAITPDYQAGAETTSTLLLAALAGFDFIYDAAGSIESSLSAGYVKLLLDHEMCGEVRRILSGIDVNDETLAVDAIRAVGPGRAFLGHPHTLRHFRTEHYSPRLFHRSPRSALARGEKSVWGKARARCEEILAEHVVDPPLDPDVEARLVDYVKGVCARYSVAAPHLSV